MTWELPLQRGRTKSVIRAVFRQFWRIYVEAFVKFPILRNSASSRENSESCHATWRSQLLSNFELKTAVQARLGRQEFFINCYLCSPDSCMVMSWFLKQSLKGLRMREVSISSLKKSGRPFQSHVRNSRQLRQVKSRHAVNVSWPVELLNAS